MAYFPDGAHDGVDELEPGITQTGSACAEDNTCQAPRYFKNGGARRPEHAGLRRILSASPRRAPGGNAAEIGEFAGMDYDNTADPKVGGEDFGLDNYEPEFFIPRDAWLETQYAMHQTLTDENPQDLFYFCHIHARAGAEAAPDGLRDRPFRPAPLGARRGRAPPAQAGMSGRVKIIDADGMVLHPEDEPALPADYYKFPSEYDMMCGGYDLEASEAA